MRWRKYDQGDVNVRYRCCLCCHVRTGTVIFGMFHLLFYMVALAFFTVSFIHPQLAHHKVELEPTAPKLADPKPIDALGYKSTGSNVKPALYDDVYHQENNQPVTPSWSSYPTQFPDVIWRKFHPIPLEQQIFLLLASVVQLLFVLMLIYGTLKTRPQLLMPFFCLQLFDFIITCLSSVSMTSVSDTRKWIEAQQDLPFKEKLLSLSNDWLMLIVVLAVVAVLFFKAYLLDMVWSCYKFLIEVIRTGHVVNVAHHHDEEMVLPPKYEDVMSMPPETYSHGPPPPPYAAIN